MLTRAKNSTIWDLVNPDRTVKPIALQKPAEPDYEVSDDGNLFDNIGYEVYKAREEVEKV